MGRGAHRSRKSGLTIRRFQNSLTFDKPWPPSLDWEDFAHLGEPSELAARIVETLGTTGGSSEAAPTFFTALLEPARASSSKSSAPIGTFASASGGAGEYNSEPNGRGRIAALMIANAIGKHLKFQTQTLRPEVLT